MLLSYLKTAVRTLWKLVGIALLTIATQTFRAARIDPARTLRDE